MDFKVLITTEDGKKSSFIPSIFKSKEDAQTHILNQLNDEKLFVAFGSGLIVSKREIRYLEVYRD